MKKIKNFLIAELVILLVKVLGGLLTHSFTMIASGVYELVLIIISLIASKISENKKYKGILSSLLGFIFIALGLGIIFISFLSKIKRTSIWIILFILIVIITRYVVSCFNINFTYQKKKGLLNFANINSSVDFYNYAVIIGALILSKISKWVGILKYADRVGTILIAGLVIIKGLKIIIHSFSYLEDKNKVMNESYKEEILKRKEVKNISKLEVSSYGGLNKAILDFELNDGISLVDANTFAITLQDYLLKIADIVEINLVEKKVQVVKKAKVRSKKQDARNSRSGNSKTNTKKKNTKQKNKKR